MVILRKKRRAKHDKSDEVTAALAAIIAPARATTGVMHLDIGAALELTSATMLLVVLRAAESWAPESEDVTQPDAVICREGRVLVEFTDGSTQQLDLDAEFLPN